MNETTLKTIVEILIENYKRIFFIVRGLLWYNWISLKNLVNLLYEKKMNSKCNTVKTLEYKILAL